MMTDTVTRFGSAACAAIASLAGLFLFCPASSAEQTASTAFRGNGIPEGWTSVENTLVSPAYPNSATKISISYAPSGDTKGSVRISSGESNLATLSTDTSSAEMTFPETTDFRHFSISAENASLLSFTAHYLDSRLASIPKINIDSYTPNSVSLSWDAIPDAGGYSVSIFTNTVEGASAGTKTWVETFADMPVNTNNNTQLKSQNLETADHGQDSGENWQNTSFTNLYWISGDEYKGFRLGNSSNAGRIIVPHTIGEENRLVISAYRNKSTSANLSISYVTYGTNAGTYTSTNLIANIELSSEPKEYAAEIPAEAAGGKILLESYVTNTNASATDCRVAITNIAFVSGWSAGTTVRKEIRTIETQVPSCSADNLPSTEITVKVKAIASDRRIAESEAAAIDIDLGRAPRLVLPGSLVAAGYQEDFSRLGDINDGNWLNGATVPYIQAVRNNGGATNITVRAGGYQTSSAPSAGLYAFRDKNKTDDSLWSLAAAPKSNAALSFGFAVSNDMAQAKLLGFVLAFDAMQWSFTSNRTAVQTMKVEYTVGTNGETSISSEGEWHELEAMSLTAKTWDDYNNATDGENGFDKTNVCRRETKEASLAGIELAPGNILVIRFVPKGVASGEALGIDNLSLRCNAEEIVKSGFFLHLANKK